MKNQERVLRKRCNTCIHYENRIESQNIKCQTLNNYDIAESRFHVLETCMLVNRVAAENILFALCSKVTGY